jgi:hypothetical protein
LEDQSQHLDHGTLATFTGAQAQSLVVQLRLQLRQLQLVVDFCKFHATRKKIEQKMYRATHFKVGHMESCRRTIPSVFCCSSEELSLDVTQPMRQV